MLLHQQRAVPTVAAGVPSSPTATTPLFHLIDLDATMDLMDAPVEDGAMPSPADMGVGLDQEKMAAFDAAVNKRRDDEAALVTKNQAEAKSALAQLETERQTQFQGRMQANREKEQVKMEQMAADNEVAEPVGARRVARRFTGRRRRGGGRHVAHAPGLHPDEELGEGERLVLCS